MDDIELNAILFYADFLSLQDISIPVTDTCKYFFIYKTPINISYVANNKLVYDQENFYFKKSYTEYMLIKDKFGEDGIMSFISNVGNIGVAGCVDGIQMLKCIHQYSRKEERKNAFNKYKQHVKNIRYSHLVKGEDGKLERTECTKYVAHYESAHKCNTEPKIHDGAIESEETIAKNI